MNNRNIHNIVEYYMRVIASLRMAVNGFTRSTDHGHMTRLTDDSQSYDHQRPCGRTPMWTDTNVNGQ